MLAAMAIRIKVRTLITYYLLLITHEQKYPIRYTLIYQRPTFKYFLKLNLLLWLAIALASCQSSPANNPSPSNNPSAGEEETRHSTQLILNKAVLEQSNQQDNTNWKIKADSIVYSEDQQTAILDRVVANLLQDGEILLKISGDAGEIRDNGNVIILQENIVAIDSRNNSVIKSNLIEWRPQESLLLIKDDLKAIHSNLEIDAQKGRYHTNTESLEIEGDVLANTLDPALQLKSDRLMWNVAQDLVSSPGAVEIVRYDEQENVTDKLVGDRAEVNLTETTATLEDNIELISLQPKIQAASQSIVWNYQQRIGKTDKPIQILDRDRQISLRGNRGEVDLLQQITKLSDGVEAINRQRESQLYARQLSWMMDTEKIEATGNVIYEQADPQARLTGEKAVGILGSNNITVTSNGQKQVTSVIK